MRRGIIASDSGVIECAEAACERLQDAFSHALGADVRVAPRREGYTVTLAVDSLAEAEALAERLGAVHQA